MHELFAIVLVISNLMILRQQQETIKIPKIKSYKLTSLTAEKCLKMQIHLGAKYTVTYAETYNQLLNEKLTDI